MKDEKSLDVVQEVFLSLAQSIGLSKKEMMAEIDDNEQCHWVLDYEISLDDQFNRHLERLIFLFGLSKKARMERDELAAFAALVGARVYAHRLMNLFENIEGELDKVLFRDARFIWPEIPENYEFPDHYGVIGF
ncbi:MAG: hypothetical protein JO174_03670 [Herbaspirillum sp.]|nr:hypothetical protein [Herbaspirillum sp.]